MRQIPGEILEAMAGLGRAFPNWKIEEATVRHWDDCLKDLDPREVLKAALHFTRTSEYPPTIAGIRKLVTAGDKISADEAWEKCRRGEMPPNESAARAIKAIGNPFARGTHSGPRAMASEMGTLHAHFRDAYNAFEEKREWHEEDEAIETLESFNKADLAELDRQELRQIDGPESELEEE